MFNQIRIAFASFVDAAPKAGWGGALLFAGSARETEFFNPRRNEYGMGKTLANIGGQNVHPPDRGVIQAAHKLNSFDCAANRRRTALSNEIGCESGIGVALRFEYEKSSEAPGGSEA
jgi:hypothetical protein